MMRCTEYVIPDRCVGLLRASCADVFFQLTENHPSPVLTSVCASLQAHQKSCRHKIKLQVHAITHAPIPTPTLNKNMHSHVYAHTHTHTQQQQQQQQQQQTYTYLRARTCYHHEFGLWWR